MRRPGADSLGQLATAAANPELPDQRQVKLDPNEDLSERTLRACSVTTKSSEENVTFSPRVQVMEFAGLS
jgi:hypothetical protein